jgi:hypothetical protein
LSASRSAAVKEELDEERLRNLENALKLWCHGDVMNQVFSIQSM